MAIIATKKPQKMPKMNGRVFLNPCCSPLAALAMLFGPGDKVVLRKKAKKGAQSICGMAISDGIK
jgi:hypothetical protein